MINIKLIEDIAEKVGIRKYLAYLYNNYFVKILPIYIPDSRQLVNENMDKIKRVLNILSDEKSRQIYNTEINNRLNMTANFKSIKEGNEYLIDELFDGNLTTENNKKEVIVDAGAYRGDTIKAFMKFFRCGYNVEKIYAFEADHKNTKILEKNILRWNYQDKVSIIPNALYDSNTKLSFQAKADVSSKVAEGANNKYITTINAVKLDDIITDKVTFIKMDIEGSEMNALKGAKKIIQSHKPKLAVCLYHKPDDIWEIPILIHSFLPKYKLYIRHHGSDWNESVLYAKV